MTEKGVGWEGEEGRVQREEEEGGGCDAKLIGSARRGLAAVAASREEAGSQALLGEQIMKRSSTSGSLLSLSQWLHTHSSSAPSPCCPLSAGLGSPSLRKSFSRDSNMTKCLKSWTEGKSILSTAVKQRRGVGGGGGRGMGRCMRGCWDADVFS